MKKVNVSVIVPVYNVEQYLEKCIKSIMGQTYADIEIILIDDGSTDSSGSICDSYACRDSRIRVLHKPNGGISDARNAGLDIARGNYIAFVDSDDYIHPQLLQILNDGITQNHSQVSVCGFTRVYDGQTVNRQQYDSINWTILKKDEDRVSYLLGDGIHITFTVAWNKLYRKELFDGIRFPMGKMYEDEFTTYKLLHKASSIAYTSIPLYFYVQRAESIMHSSCSVRSLEVFEAFRERLELYDANRQYNWYCALLKIYRWRILHCLDMSKQNKSIDYCNKWKEYKKYYNRAILQHLKYVSSDKKNCLKHFAVVFFPKACICIKAYE